jgi:hypothetical protein
MHYACALFSEIQMILLNSQNPERCTDSVIWPPVMALPSLAWVRRVAAM